MSSARAASKASCDAEKNGCNELTTGREPRGGDTVLAVASKETARHRGLAHRPETDRRQS